jgi:adenine deaminase
MRRLNIDAAKVMKYGGVPEQDALRMITLNPAIQLGIDKRTGSVTVGKDADLVIWNGHPFSVYSQVETTMIEGEIYFERKADLAKRADMQKEREALEGKDVNKPSQGGGAPRIPTERRIEDRDDADQNGGGDDK